MMIILVSTNGSSRCIAESVGYVSSHNEDSLVCMLAGNESAGNRVLAKNVQCYLNLTAIYTNSDLCIEAFKNTSSQFTVVHGDCM